MSDTSGIFKNEQLEQAYFNLSLQRKNYLDSLASKYKYGFKNTNAALVKYTEAMEKFFALLLNRKGMGSVLDGKKQLISIENFVNSLF